MAITVTITRDRMDSEYRKAYRKAEMYRKLFELTKNNAKLEGLNCVAADKCGYWTRRCLRVLDKWCGELERRLIEELP